MESITSSDLIVNGVVLIRGRRLFEAGAYLRRYDACVWSEGFVSFYSST